MGESGSAHYTERWAAVIAAGQSTIARVSLVSDELGRVGWSKPTLASSLSLSLSLALSTGDHVCVYTGTGRMPLHDDEELDFGEDELAVALAPPPPPAPALAPQPTPIAPTPAPAAAPSQVQPPPPAHNEHLDEHGNPLPEGWVSRVSKSTKRIYYRNTRLNTSEWDIPTKPAHGPTPTPTPTAAQGELPTIITVREPDTSARLVSSCGRTDCNSDLQRVKRREAKQYQDGGERL